MKIKALMMVLILLSFQVFISCDKTCTDCDECGNEDTDVTASGDKDISDAQVVEDKDTEVADENDEMIKDEDQEEDDSTTDNEADDADAEKKCKIITLGELWVDSYTDGADYSGEPNEALGDADVPDWVQMMFYDYSEEESEDAFDFTVGTFDLGTEDNQNLGTCTECILVFEDIDEESEDFMGGPAKTYFQESGSVEITEIKAGTGQSKGIVNAKLVQVYLDMFSMDVIKVEGGDCLELKDEAFDTFCKLDCTDKICGSDGCYGECGECESGFECNETGTSCDLIPTDDDVMPDADTDA